MFRGENGSAEKGLLFVQSYADLAIALLWVAVLQTRHLFPKIELIFGVSRITGIASTAAILFRWDFSWIAWSWSSKKTLHLLSFWSFTPEQNFILPSKPVSQHRWIPQRSTQLEDGLRCDPFEQESPCDRPEAIWVWDEDGTLQKGLRPWTVNFQREYGEDY